MKDLLRLKTLVFNQPQMCTPDYADVVLSVLRGEEIDREPKEGREKDIRGNTLVLPIEGSMTHKASWLDAASGIQSYESIKATLEDSLRDPNIQSVLLDIDSPGGTVAGAFDLRDYILSYDKPIYALARDSMASAAYLIGSACDKLYTTQTGSVGSIGVVAMHVDQSKANEDMGIKPTFIYAGDMKVAGNPHEKLEGEALNYIQESVNDSYEMFVNAVAEARGIDAQGIRDTQARVYRGEKAVGIGLADGVRTFEAALEELANVSPKRVNSPYKSKGKSMENEEVTLEAAVAEAAQLKADNEALRKQVLDAGFKITKEGLVAPEDTKEPEMIEVAGVLTDKATLPEHVVKALETAANEKAESELKNLATTMLPNFRVEAAMAFVDAFAEDEDLIKDLKAADKVLGSFMEESGETQVDTDMVSAKDKLEALEKQYMEDHGVNIHEARTKVQETAQGRKLYIESRKEA